MAKKLKVLYLTPEAAPLAKTGGLADVALFLPKSLRELGVDIRVLMPFYQLVREKIRDNGLPAPKPGPRFTVIVHGELTPARVHTAKLPGGVTLYLLENERFFSRAGVYGEAGFDYPDNHLRFIFFSASVRALLKAVDFTPDIIHANEWPTGLVPAYLKTLWKDSPRLKGTRSLFTIHNVAYQGNFPLDVYPATSLPWELFSPAGVEFYGWVSFLKAAVLFADLLTTVSPSHREEIMTPEFGFGMDGVLRERKASLMGVLNGVDYKTWNPEADPHIPAKFSAANVAGKKRCKKRLIEELGLDPSLGARPIIGMVSRLARQKGIDLIFPLLGHLLRNEALLAVLGSGEGWLEERLSAAATENPGRLGLKLGFDEGLAHRIEAGADLFLMPSRYEPCGLNQLYSLRYGTAPVVAATGGLKDTVEEFDPKTGEGTGFMFHEPATESLALALGKGLALFGAKSIWRKLIRNAMGRDFSWERAAGAYLELYEGLMLRDTEPAEKGPVSRGTRRTP